MKGVTMSRRTTYPEEYYNQFIPTGDAVLLEVEAEARRLGIAIVGPVVGELLFILARLSGAKRILELGTSLGYSGIFLARACELTGGRVMTLEANQSLAMMARNNFQRATVNHVVDLTVGEALDKLTYMEEKFDFIFLDLDQKNYKRALSHCQRLLRRGGLLVASSGGGGETEEFDQAVSHRNEWRAVQLFSYLPFHTPEWDRLCLALRT